MKTKQRPKILCLVCGTLASNLFHVVFKYKPKKESWKSRTFLRISSQPSCHNSSWWLQMIISNLSQHSCISLKLKFAIFFARSFVRLPWLFFFWCDDATAVVIFDDLFWFLLNAIKTRDFNTSLECKAYHAILLCQTDCWNRQDEKFKKYFFSG